MTVQPDTNTLAVHLAAIEERMLFAERDGVYDYGTEAREDVRWLIDQARRLVARCERAERQLREADETIRPLVDPYNWHGKCEGHGAVFYVGSDAATEKILESLTELSAALAASGPDTPPDLDPGTSAADVDGASIAGHHESVGERQGRQPGSKAGPDTPEDA